MSSGDAGISHVVGSGWKYAWSWDLTPGPVGETCKVSRGTCQSGGGGADGSASGPLWMWGRDAVLLLYSPLRPGTGWMLLEGQSVGPRLLYSVPSVPGRRAYRNNALGTGCRRGGWILDGRDHPEV